MGKHSIKNPDSFSDCIEMLVGARGNNNYNYDILSERCFKMVIRPNPKTWISSQLSLEESIDNIFVNSGIKLQLHKAKLLSLQVLQSIAITGAVFGPMEKHTFNQTVEELYFLGGKHYIFLAGETDDFFVLHDPDSSPYILIEKEQFKSTISEEGVYCITLDEYCEKTINYKGIVKKNLLHGTHLLLSDTPPIFNKGIGGIASYKYGLRLYLFYLKELIDCINSTGTSELLRPEIDSFFIFAAEGYQHWTWNYFLSITERGEKLIQHLAETYVYKKSI